MTGLRDRCDRISTDRASGRRLRRAQTPTSTAATCEAAAASAATWTALVTGYGHGYGGHGTDAHDVRHEPDRVAEPDRRGGAGNAGAEQWRHGNESDERGLHESDGRALFLGVPDVGHVRSAR